LVAAPFSFDLFSRAGNPARAKVILLGSIDQLPLEVMNRVSSLHIEHVSPARLMRRGISRPVPRGNHADETTLALLRHWFWARKPDAGFLLTDFPATLLQAQVLDEWFDARGEQVDQVIGLPETPADLLRHYRTLGLLSETAAASRSRDDTD
jgi:adenylate kinase